MRELRLENLPDIPQTAALHDVVRRLWQRPDVVAIWLGGSLATGKADHFSDVDLRVAVAPNDLENWRTLEVQTVFDSSPVAHQVQLIGSDQILHNVLLADGNAYDLYIQNTLSAIEEEHIKILACRDEVFERRLAENRSMDHVDHQAQGTAILKLLIDFWVNSHKHRKVIFRELDLAVMIGIHHDRQAVLRLWYIAATGLDSTNRPSIHGLTRMVRAVQEAMGAHAMEIMGADLSTRSKLIAVIEILRDEVSRHGRSLALKYGFQYPTTLENTVRRSWADFLDLNMNDRDD